MSQCVADRPRPRPRRRENDGNGGSFGFERLDVYQAAVEFIRLAAQVIADLPPGYHPYADQLKRAALSIAVNIAEGTGRTSSGDRRRHYGIARGSAMECAAILDACKAVGAAGGSPVSEGRALLIRIVAMLTKMCR